MFRRLALSKLELAMILPFQRWKRSFPLTEYSYSFRELLDFEGEGWKKTFAFPVAVQIQLCS